MRMLTTETRLRIEEIISRLALGKTVTLDERIQLKKYSLRIPFIAGKLARALRQRQLLDAEEII